MDQDRIMGRMVVEYIGEVFSFLVTDLGNFVDWATKSDPLYDFSNPYYQLLKRLIKNVQQTRRWRPVCS